MPCCSTESPIAAMAAPRDEAACTARATAAKARRCAAAEMIQGVLSASLRAAHVRLPCAAHRAREFRRVAAKLNGQTLNGDHEEDEECAQ